MSHGNPRFSIIPAAAVTDPRVEPRDLQVICLLGRHTDNHGWCCRSQVKMARELRCGRATVQRALARLVDTGYVEHRPIWRESGADAAHEYRVVIDRMESAEAVDAISESRPDGGAHLWAGVPTGGQGVPTHERAPMLTTPVKRSDGERARGEKDFEQALRTWPSGFADSRDDAWSEWLRLSNTDRALAFDEMPRFITATKAVGRSRFCSLAKYMRERKWEALPPRPKPVERAESNSALASPPKAKPTAFQLANPHLFPELFPEHAVMAGEVAA